MKFYDLIIVGAGPSGLMAGIGAKQIDPNLSVAIIDKNLGFNHKIGEAFLTGTIMAFQEAGLIQRIAKENFHRKIGAAYVWGESKEPWYVNYPLDNTPYPSEFKDDKSRYAIHVPRHKFEQVLKEEAKNRDIDLIEDQVSFELNKNLAKKDIENELNTPESKDKNFDYAVLSVKGIKQNYCAKYYIDASGQAAIFAKNNDMRISIGHPRIGKYCYVQNINWKAASDSGFDIHRTNIISNQHGWMWVIHLGERGDGLTSLGFIAHPDIIRKMTFDNIGDFFPEIYKFGISKIIPKDVYNQVVDKWYSQPDFSFKSKKIHGRNWALVGDAAMFIDPILSQGATLACHYGLLRGRAAVEHINGNPTYQENVTKHYYNEGNVLLDIVTQWYSNNRIVKDWKLKAVFHSESIYHEIKNQDEAFRFITNLENIKKEYWPYPASEQKKIDQHLKTDNSHLFT